MGKYVKKRILRFLIIIPMMMSSGCALLQFLPVPYEDLSIETREPIHITLEPIQESIVTPTPADMLVVPVIITEEISEEGTAPRYIIQVRYPQIETQAEIAPAFNLKVEQMMNEFVQSFLKEISGTGLDDSSQEFVNGLTSDYRLAYIDSNQISVNFLQSVYFAGAAHPLPFSRTINYDLRTNRVLELDEVFIEGADYIARISEYALADLRQQGVLEWEEGASPSAENFESWNVTSEGLLFTFDPYQVAPYAAGFQEVLIPYEAIGDILREDGPAPPLNFE